MRKRFVPILEATLKSQFPQDMHGQVCSLLKKVKERLNNADNYCNFLTCIKYYYSENICRPQRKAHVKDLLGAHPDLMEAFNKVVDHKKKTGIVLFTLIFRICSPFSGFETLHLNLDKLKEVQPFNKNGKRKRQSLIITRGSKRSQSSNKDTNKRGPDVSTARCRLIPCDVIHCFLFLKQVKEGDG
ncbi:putative transcription regulator Others family [Helianthus annuus]|nr:putative transcription regulator Others family [Helianthus annuus]